MVEKIDKVAMSLGTIAVHYLVRMIHAFAKVAHPMVARTGEKVARYQQVVITLFLCRIQHLFRPARPLGDASLHKDRECQPLTIGSSASLRSSARANASAGWRAVHTSGAAHPFSAIHAGPRRQRSS